MAQDLTDVLCTAGKQSAVLPLFPFHFHSPISLFIFSLPISLFIFSLPISLSVCSPRNALSHIKFFSPTLFPFISPISPLIFASSIFPTQFVFLPLPLSLYPPPSVPFPYSLNLPPKLLSSIFPFLSVAFPLPLSAFMPLPLCPFSLFIPPSIPSYFSLIRSPFQSVPSHFPTSLPPFSLPMCLFHLFLPQSLPSHFFIDPIFSISLLPSHYLSAFNPSHCSLFHGHSPCFL